MTGPKVTSMGELERVVITTGDGRTFDLGKPSSRLFWLRVQLYKARRRIRG